MTGPTGEADSTGTGVPVRSLEEIIGRLLFGGTVVGVALLLVGVVLMAAGGIDPTGGRWPQFDPGRLVPDLLGLRAEGFLWAGIVVLIGTPVARVTGELVAFAARRDAPMTLVAGAILGVIALSVVLAVISDR